MTRIKSSFGVQEFEKVRECLGDYIESTVDEVTRRKKGIQMNFQTYKEQRPILSGSTIMFNLTFIFNKIKLPQKVFDHESFGKIRDSALEMLSYINVSGKFFLKLLSS